MNICDFLFGASSGLLVGIVASWFWGTAHAVARNSLRNNIVVRLLDTPQTYVRENRTYWTIEVKTKGGHMYRMVPQKPSVELSAEVQFARTDKGRCTGKAYNVNMGFDSKEVRFRLRDKVGVELAILYRSIDTMILHPLDAKDEWNLKGDWDMEVIIKEDSEIIFRKSFPNYISGGDPTS